MVSMKDPIAQGGSNGCHKTEQVEHEHRFELHSSHGHEDDEKKEHGDRDDD